VANTEEASTVAVQQMIRHNTAAATAATADTAAATSRRQTLASKVGAYSAQGAAAQSGDVEALLQQIARWNAYGPVLNFDHSGASDKDSSLAGTPDGEAKFEYIVAVMASSRPAYLSLLLEALDRMPRPESVLVIVSHDGLHAPTLAAVQTVVKNLRVKQLVFPLARSLLGRHFPGREPQDCADDGMENTLGGSYACHGETDT
jgi:hypothetical protein